MKYFYDCEFKERGGAYAIEAISIGIYAEDGREFYAVYNDFDTRAVAQDNWLMTNVMSSIAHEKFVVADFEGSPVVRDIFVTDPAKMHRDEIAAGIEEFTLGDTDIEWWNWYGAYDHVVLCQTFGTMMDLGERYPKWSNDIKQLHKDKGFPKMPRQPEGLHNALADAKFNKARYDFLTSL